MAFVLIPSSLRVLQLKEGKKELCRQLRPWRYNNLPPHGTEKPVTLQWRPEQSRYVLWEQQNPLTATSSPCTSHLTPKTSSPPLPFPCSSAPDSVLQSLPCCMAPTNLCTGAPAIDHCLWALCKLRL